MGFAMRKLPSSRTPADLESAIFAAELGESASLDLHGETADAARHDIEAFIDRSFLQGEPVIKIIHGRGGEILKRMTEKILAKHPLVEYSRGSTNFSESGAVTYAVLALRPSSLSR
jgi:DNA-nicking Smr family endonuclease